jgi:hypothetical protein
MIRVFGLILGYVGSDDFPAGSIGYVEVQCIQREDRIFHSLTSVS